MGWHRARERAAAPLEPTSERWPGLEPRVERVDQGEEDRVERDRDDRSGDDELVRLDRQNAEADAGGGKDEAEFADLGKGGAHRETRSQRIAEERQDADGGERLADHHQRQHGEDRQRVGDQIRRVEQHADGDEEQHGEGITQRQGIGGGLVREVRLADHRTREECAEGK